MAIWDYISSFYDQVNAFLFFSFLLSSLTFYVVQQKFLQVTASSNQRRDARRRGPYLSQVVTNLGRLGAETVEPRNADHEPFPHTCRDAYHAAFLLRQVVVPDLVPTILEMAEYWVVDSAHSDHEVDVNERDTGSDGFSVMQSPSITSLRIRKIVITIQSKDQGWSSYSQDYGTYRNSWSWFEVRVSGDQALEKRRMLLTNMHAGQYYIKHQVVWRADAEDEAERQWMRSLQVGEHFTVAAFARFPGWRNSFKSGRIDLYYSPVRRL